MTPRQRELLTFFTAYVGERGMAPAYKEMAYALGLKTASGVTVHINALVSAGLIVRTRGYRGLRLPPAKCCPNCGHSLTGAAA
jgi:SOS-response transcriptional repressor LexA